MEQKRILLCCGTGIATSTVANNKLCTELDKRGYKGMYTITQCKASEVPSKSADYDVCVSTIVNSYKCECPMVIAIGIILNKNTKEIYDEICQILGFE